MSGPAPPWPPERRRLPSPRPGPPDAVERTLRTCPNCGAELGERKCKLFCPRPGCGYYLSCADYL